MIKANEMRIGNYAIDNKGHIVIIKEIAEGTFNGTVRVLDTSHYDEDVLFGFGCSEISGISITEDWLIRMGFEKAKDANDYFGGWLKLLPNDNRIRVIYDGVKYYHDVGFIYVDCNTVHQLQNLYFALIGTELTLNKPLQSTKTN